MRMVRLPAFAKVNLCLDLLGRRPDGYHELRTIFQAISLHDTLSFELRRQPGIELEIVGDAALAAEPARNNLVYRAVHAVRGELNLRSGVRVKLEKRIPVGRGLGGGSSDAAATLAGLLRLTGRKLPLERQVALAASLGADVPFFLFGGRALGVGRGDEIYPLPDSPRQTILVVSPRGVAVPTREAFRWASRRLTNRETPSKLWRFCALCWSAPGAPLSNDFEAAVFRRWPRLRNIKRGLLQRGAAEAALAGSGSAVYGVFRNPALARRAAQGFPNDQIFVCTTLTREEYRRAQRGSGSF